MKMKGSNLMEILISGPINSWEARVYASKNKRS